MNFQTDAIVKLFEAAAAGRDLSLQAVEVQALMAVPLHPDHLEFLDLDETQVETIRDLLEPRFVHDRGNFKCLCYRCEAGERIAPLVVEGWELGKPPEEGMLPYVYDHDDAISLAASEMFGLTLRWEPVDDWDERFEIDWPFNDVRVHIDEFYALGFKSAKAKHGGNPAGAPSQ